MDAALVASALLMGLAGGPHCAAMCGAACGTVAGARRPVSSALVALHAGRLAGYAAGGAIAAAGVASLGSFATAAPLVRPLWSIVHVAAVALGVWLLWTARTPGWLSRLSPRVAAVAGGQPIRFVRHLPRPAGAAIAGTCWVAIPCGLLQSALLVAALASTPAAGAATMAAFAIGSTFVLVVAQGAWSSLRRLAPGTALGALSVRIAGALLAGASLLALWNGLGAAICSAFVA
jgi:sulfite exporter TauE/SafE